MSESYSVSIGVSANGVEEAISRLQQLDDLLGKINGNTATVSVQLSEDVINRIKDIEDTVASVNGVSAVASVTLADNATNMIADVKDEIAAIDGSTATITIEGAVAGGAGGFGGGNGGNLFYDLFGTDAQHFGFKNGYNAMNSAKSGVMGFADSYTNAMLRYGGRATALVGGVGLGRIMNDYSSWDYQLADTKGVIDPSERTPENMQMLADYTKSYAQKGFTPLQVAQAQTELAKAGFKVNEMGDILPAMLNVSNAGGLDIETSTLITSSALRSFNLEAKDAAHVSDVLAKAANATNADILGLGESIKYSGSYANALGIPIESLTATLGVLSNYNIRASQAGTTLRSVMSRLVSPTDEATKVMDKYNMSFVDGEGNVKDFTGIIQTLNDGLKDATSSEKAAAVKAIFGQTAIAGVLSLMNAGPEAIRQMTDELYNCGGAAQQMADIKLDTLMGEWKKFKGEVSVTAIEIGKELAPIASDFLTYLQGKLPTIKDNIVSIAKFLAGHSEELGQFASGIAKFSAAMMGLSFAGNVIKQIQGIGSILSGLTGTAGLSGAAAAINPVTVAILGLGGAFAYLYTKSSEFRFDFDNKFGETVDAAKELKQALDDLANIDLGPLGDLGNVTESIIGEAFLTGLGTVKETIQGIADGLSGIKQFWDGVFNGDNFDRIDGIVKTMGGLWNFTHPMQGAISEEIEKAKQWFADSNEVSSDITLNTTEKVTKEVEIEVTENGSEEVKSKIEEIKNLYSDLTNGGTASIDVSTDEAMQKYQELLGLMQELPEGTDFSVELSGSEQMISDLQNVKTVADEMSGQGVDISVDADTTTATSNCETCKAAVDSIPSSHDTSITCSGADAAASAAASVASAVNSIPSSKTVTITVNKVGSENIAENASGTDFFNGGLTTVAENGYEIVSFSKGTKIFSHGDSKQILNDYYKNQTSLAKAAGAENQGYQVNKGTSNGNVTYVSFAIQGGNTKEIVSKVAMQLTDALNSRG